MPRKPAIIRVRQVLSGRKNPKWHYMRIWSMATQKVTLEPCCLKSKPCWECK